MKFASYFSPKSIIEVLCLKRALLARHRHDVEFEQRISSHEEDIISNAVQIQLSSMLPPRNLWLRTPKKQRRISPLEENVQALHRTISYYIKNEQPAHSAWLQNLNKFIAAIRGRALSETGHYFQYEEIGFILKEGDRYRPITKFGLEDRVLDTLLAKYFRDCLDPLFLPCSFAFRSRRNSVSVTHHDAFKAIVNYHERQKTDSKWVAECDLEAFFDCISHRVVELRLSELAQRYSKEGKELDSRALRLFSAYLDSYTFPRDVKAKGLKDFKIKYQGKENAYCKWPDGKLIQFHEDPFRQRIGIPQGGALSCFMANMVLDFADRAVTEPGENDELFYARYCDDIIIIHNQKEVCKAALERYIEAIKQLQLPIHTPKQIKKYGRLFWNEKSKEPYHWTNQTCEKDRVPWASFVGYQLHYNGTIRVRPSSIDREIKKQNGLILRIRHLVRRAIELNYEGKLSPGDIIHRVRLRLISMAVGRRRVYDLLDTRQRYCWVSGFCALDYRNYAKYQLRRLDRTREKSLRRLASRLSKLPMAAVNSSSSTTSSSQKKERPCKYYGHPFSYAAQFKK